VQTGGLLSYSPRPLRKSAAWPLHFDRLWRGSPGDNSFEQPTKLVRAVDIHHESTALAIVIVTASSILLRADHVFR
jgi:hypothetical protein